jgi:DNA-binding beta-propeller fold protein YncE
MNITWIRLSAVVVLSLVSLVGGFSRAAQPVALELVQTITLQGPVGKRLDHLALDARRGRLFVANMANASFDVVDLKAAKVLMSVPGQRGVQGIAYAPDVDRVFVGVGEDGVCNVFDGKDYKLEKAIKLEDADNVRYDVRTRRVLVAHAEMSLAVIDPQGLEVKAKVRLPGQAEAYQLEADRPRLYLNVPSAKAVVVIDTDSNAVVATYRLKLAGQNYPLALDEKGHRLFVGCRKPAAIVFLDTESGKELGNVTIPGDVDDVFYDGKHKRLYASCGEGVLAVLREAEANRFAIQESIPTVKLARTCLFDAESGRLFLAVPRQAGKGGPEIRVYRARP